MFPRSPKRFPKRNVDREYIETEARRGFGERIAAFPAAAYSYRYYDIGTRFVRAGTRAIARRSAAACSDGNKTIRCGAFLKNSGINCSWTRGEPRFTGPLNIPDPLTAASAICERRSRIILAAETTILLGAFLRRAELQHRRESTRIAADDTGRARNRGLISDDSSTLELSSC